MELPAEACAAADVGKADIIDEMMGPNCPGEMVVLEMEGTAMGVDDPWAVDAAPHPPKRPSPRMLQPIELTSDVTLARGALGTVAATS